jgi:hypothetical protein
MFWDTRYISVSKSFYHWWQLPKIKWESPKTFQTDGDCVWNVMAHAQKSDFFFRLNVRVHLNRWVLQFSRLLAAQVCASAVVMLDTPRSEVVCGVLATHSIRRFPLHFPSLRPRVPSGFKRTITLCYKRHLCYPPFRRYTLKLWH